MGNISKLLRGKGDNQINVLKNMKSTVFCTYGFKSIWRTNTLFLKVGKKILNVSKIKSYNYKPTYSGDRN